MEGIGLPILLAVIVGVVEFYSKRYNLKKKRNGKQLRSFFSGMSITYLLLELFPRFTEVAITIDKKLFVAVLVGFITHHIVEKYIYTHNHRHDLIKMLSLEESAFYFIYHFVFGIVLVTVFRTSSVEGFLFFVSIMSYTLVSNLPANVYKSYDRALLLSSSTLLGVLFHTFIWINIPIWFEYSLMGLAVGVLLFTVTRHHIPFGRKGVVSYFTLGFILYGFLIVMSWYLR